METTQFNNVGNELFYINLILHCQGSMVNYIGGGGGTVFSHRDVGSNTERILDGSVFNTHMEVAVTVLYLNRLVVLSTLACFPHCGTWTII